MQKAIICVVLFVALALAQSPQNGPLNVQTLTSGVNVAGSLLPTTAANNYHVDIYQIWVPENTTAVNFTYGNADSTSCSYVHFFFRDEAPPCSYHDYSSSLYACANAYDPGNGISGNANFIAYPGYDNDLFQFGVNKYLYVAVGRYGMYNTKTCTYNLMATLNGSCPTGSIGQALSSSQTTCSPAYTGPVTSGTQYAMSNTVGTGYQAVYRVDVPQGTGHIYVLMNSTSSGAYIYGKNYADGTYTGYDCYTSSYTSVGNYYIYDLFCFTPRSGEFFFTIQDDNTFTGSVSYTVQVCPAGMGGFNCSFVSLPLNVSTLPMTVNIPYSSSDSVNYLYYGMYYLYVDIPGNVTNGNEIAVLANVQSGSGYMFYRRNGYPEDSSTFGYEDSFEYDSYPASYSVNQFEWQVPGRIYFGFQCTTSGGCNVSITANTSSTSSSGVVTTGGSGVVTTGASGVVTTGASGVVTTGASGMVTTANSTLTTAAVTSSRITSAGMTTSRASGSMTTSQAESSISSTLIPSAILGLIAYFLF